MSAPSFRAITTRYKGYNFRSRLEARWAVFFDHLNIRWEYEPEGFELGNGLRYLPDFWLPDWKMWVEVKPGEPDEVACEKAWRLVRASGFALFASHGMPDSSGTLFISYAQQGGEIGLWDLPAIVAWNRACIFVFHHAISTESIADIEQEIGYADYVIAPPQRLPQVAKAVNEWAAPAVDAARGARFEFGNKGVL